MIVRRLVPASEVVDLDHADAKARLAELYAPPRRRFLRLNLVSSVGGSAVGPDGTSNSLTAGADRALLGVVRALADVVLVGAQSVRAEGYVLPRAARLAVVTGSGDLTGHRIPADAERGRVLVLCPPAAVARVRETMSAAEPVELTAGADGQVDPVDVVRALRGRGLESIVCEGGPTLAARLLAADVVDEVCLSTSPVVTAAVAPVFGGDPFDARPARLAQLMTDDTDALYARWALDRP